MPTQTYKSAKDGQGALFNLGLTQLDDGTFVQKHGLINTSGNAINPATAESQTTLIDNVGPTNAAAATSDTGTFSLMSLFKRLLSKQGAEGDTPPTLSTNASGILGYLRGIYDRVTSGMYRPAVTYTKVVGSPFTLTSSWVKVATTTSATRALRIAPIASAVTFDIEWTWVAANASAPTDTYGEPVLGGEDFAAGVPIGDIYLKSATGQIALVRTGV